MISERSLLAGLALSALICAPAPAMAEGGLFGWIHGDWALKLGATGMVAPDFEGSRKYMFSATPIISLGKAGPEARFTSRNDGISISLYDTGAFRAGINGKFIFGRDDGDSDSLRGIDPVRFGGELGGFAEVYPTDWLRVRGEVRHGIRSHDGIVADISADAFMDVTETIRVSAGPRMTVASADYFDAYYGVDAARGSGFRPVAVQSRWRHQVGRRRRRHRLEGDRHDHHLAVRRICAPGRAGRRLVAS